MVAGTIVAGVKLASMFAPKILSLFGSDKSKDVEKISSTVMDIAKGFTGESDEDKVIKVLSSDPNLALKFQMAVMEDSHVSEKLAYQDRAGARQMYGLKNEQQDAIAQNVMKYNLVAVLFVLIAQGAAMVLLEDKGQLLALIGNAAGYITNSLLKERQDVISFFFSSSLGSKLKTLTGK